VLVLVLELVQVQQPEQGRQSEREQVRARPSEEAPTLQALVGQRFLKLQVVRPEASKPPLQRGPESGLLERLLLRAQPPGPRAPAGEPRQH
jgi:hypothetical protein